MTPVERLLGKLPDAKRAGNSKPNGKPRIVASYDYRDESGELLFQVARLDPKAFRQRRPKLEGGWNWSVKGGRVVPYRLPEFLAEPARSVFVVEGEKDVDNLARIGLLGTCNAGGPGKWTAEHSAFLRGRKIIVLPGNDEPGRNHAQQAARSLHGIADSVRVVNWPGLADKRDVSDWIAAGGTKDELIRLAEAAAPWTPTVAREPGSILTCLADVKPRPVTWLWAGRIPLGRITLLVGRPGEGKSFLTTDAAARVTTGTPWPDGSDCPRGSVILISAEDDPADTIRPRLDAHYADVRHVHLLSAVRRVDDNGEYERLISLADVDTIEAALEQVRDCRLGDCKQFFEDAVDRELLAKNPFAKLGGNAGANRDRDHFIDRATAEKVMAACPDAEWRALFALARWGGLRVPSEIVGLTWECVNWTEGRMVVPSPKTARHAGHENRIVPLFPELRQALDELRDETPPGTQYIGNRYRDPAVNLRTQLQRIIRRAGQVPWPKLWQNLRATRATELCREHPSHVAAAWCGHSVKIADKHYRQVTESDFQRALQPVAGGAQSGAQRAQKAAQQKAVAIGVDSQCSHEPRSACDVTRNSTIRNSLLPKDLVGDTGLEPVTPSLSS